MVTADADPDDPLLVKLRAQLRGTVLSPRSADFERHRHQWNAAIDQFPRAIAICSDAEDVAIAMRIAADAAGAVTVRGGGHNIAGRSIKSGALLVDLSRLRDVVVNPVTRVAIVQGGALWSDVDAATDCSYSRQSVPSGLPNTPLNENDPRNGTLRAVRSAVRARFRGDR